MAKTTTFLEDLSKHMPMVAVRKAIQAAAGGTDAAYIADRIDKVEIKTTPRPDAYSMIVSLTVWWRLDDTGQEFHVTRREVVVDDGSTTWDGYDSILEKLLDFKPEDALKFAAYF